MSATFPIEPRWNQAASQWEYDWPSHPANPAVVGGSLEEFYENLEAFVATLPPTMHQYAYQIIPTIPPLA